MDSNEGGSEGNFSEVEQLSGDDDVAEVLSRIRAGEYPSEVWVGYIFKVPNLFRGSGGDYEIHSRIQLNNLICQAGRQSRFQLCGYGSGYGPGV